MSICEGEVSISNGSANLLEDLHVITKETSDDFLLVLSSWYEHVGSTFSNIPNVCEIFTYNDWYAQSILETFAMSLAWRDSVPIEKNHASQFTKEERDYYTTLMVDNHEVLFQHMLYDIERVLHQLSLFYVYDSRSQGGEDFIIRNEVVTEVW